MDHIAIPVSQIQPSRAFYTAALEPLGWSCSGFRDGVFAAFKKPGSPAFYLNVAERLAATHLAFRSPSEEGVRAFHAAAIGAGGHGNGPPGPRPGYGPSYYAAFVLDPDGQNIEAVLGGVG